MDEKQDRQITVRLVGVEDVDRLPWVWAVSQGKFALARALAAISGRIALPRLDYLRVLRDARPVIVFRFQIDFAQTALALAHAVRRMLNRDVRRVIRWRSPARQVCPKE
jgi:hypothetical protein